MAELDIDGREDFIWTISVPAGMELPTVAPQVRFGLVDDVGQVVEWTEWLSSEWYGEATVSEKTGATRREFSVLLAGPEADNSGLTGVVVLEPGVHLTRARSMTPREIVPRFTDPIVVR